MVILMNHSQHHGNDFPVHHNYHILHLLIPVETEANVYIYLTMSLLLCDSTISKIVMEIFNISETI